MNTYLIYKDSPYFFTSKVEELKKIFEEKIKERMCVDKIIDMDEMIELEGHSFNLEDFLKRVGRFAYNFKNPNFKDLSAEHYNQVGNTPKKKIMVYNPFYSFDFGDEPQTHFSFFIIESEEVFKEKFRELALEAHKKNKSIILEGACFCTQDHVFLEGQKITVYPPFYYIIDCP